MKILFTGASSFTGFWFVMELFKAGHTVHTLFTKVDEKQYSGIRKVRVEMLNKISVRIFNVSFGDKRFVKILQDGEYDLLCHHASFVENYKSDKFRIIEAIKRNTLNINKVFEVLQEQSIPITYSGTFFEGNEGITENNSAISLYGLSKQITFEILEYHALKNNVKLGKFVIPNPFGPFEEYGFTSYMFNCWLHGDIALVKTPSYLRDNIPVTFLAEKYVDFVTEVVNSSTNDLIRYNPSGYVETQEIFALRFAKEIRKRSHLECSLEFNYGHELLEPLIRINRRKGEKEEIYQHESGFWDELYHYYMKYHVLWTL